MFQWVPPGKQGLMGTCYSSQARVGKRTYPSDMSLSSNPTPKGAKGIAQPQGRPAFGFKKPANKNARPPRNSNEQPDNPDDRTVLATLDQQPAGSGAKSTKNDSNKKTTTRFGFRPASSKVARSDSNSNIMTNSSEIGRAHGRTRTVIL